MDNVRDYGAAGVASETRELALTNSVMKWIRYEPGTMAVIRHPQAGAVLDSVGIQAAIDAVAARPLDSAANSAAASVGSIWRRCASCLRQAPF